MCGTSHPLKLILEVTDTFCMRCLQFRFKVLPFAFLLGEADILSAVQHFTLLSRQEYRWTVVSVL